MDDQDLVALAVRLARMAAAEILAVRAAGFSVAAKPDATPVTLADMRAEAVIVTGLRQATDIPVVAEEEVAAGRAEAPGARYWLVDPLDGTREFAAGRDEFAVNIGLVRDGAPVLGAVAAPATGEIYFGIVGAGAFKQVGQDPARPIGVRAAPARLTVMASRHYADDPRLAAFLANYQVESISNIGSALKFCRVAEGLADFYPRLGTTMEWDTAAPQAVLEAAGGSVLTTGDAPLRYGKPGFRNPDFFCFGKRQ